MTQTSPKWTPRASLTSGTRLEPCGMESAVQQQHPRQPSPFLHSTFFVLCTQYPSRCCRQAPFSTALTAARIKGDGPASAGATPPALQLGRERSRRGLAPVARAHNRAPRVQRSIVARVGSRGKGGIPPFPGNPSLGAEWAAQYATFRESNPSPLLFAFLQSLQVQVLSGTRDLQLLTPFLRAPGRDLE
jgi:hypothetical protein